MKFNEIIFKEARKHVSGLINKPKPASNYIPQWYKKDKIFSNGENELLKAHKKSENFNLTYKLCTPLTDSMTAGYMLTLPADIIVLNNQENESLPNIRWYVNFNIVDIQSSEVLSNYPIPEGYNKNLFRWILDWKIITQKGYSLWVTHPAHRHDLPFFTLNGFIDTDKHPNSLFLPFFIKSGFEGIIKEGTPIAQIIPIKRENWKSLQEEYSEQENLNFFNNVKINLIRTYKNKYWTKKIYE